MKSNLLSLLRIEFKKFFSSLSSRGKKVSQTPLPYIAGLVGLLGIALSSLYTWLIVTPYVNSGVDPSPAVTLFAGVASMFIFISSMNQVRGIYIGEDYDLLTSMPIRRRDIVASKVLTLYLTELLFAVIILIPHGITAFAMTQHVTAFLTAILLAFTIPIVPIAMAMLLSLLVTMATARFKSANFVSTILYSLFVVGFAVSAMILTRLDDATATSSFSTLGNIMKWLNPSYLLVELSWTNPLYLLLYIGVNAVVAIGSVLFLSLLFDKLHSIVSSISMKKAYVQKQLKTRASGKVLLGMEFKRLVNTKIYFVNIIMNPVMAIAGSVVYLISMSRPMAEASGDALAMMKLLAMPIFVAVLMLISSIGSPTAASINIEGKTFWLIKSLPTDYKQYMRVKLLFGLILTLPATLITATIAVVFFHDNPWDIAFAYALPVVYTVLMNVIGLVVAIHHPKLKWSNEAEAVKNSASVLIAMLIGFGITFVFATLLIVVPIFLRQYSYLAYLIVTGGVLATLIPCLIYLHRNFSRKIQEMEDL